MRGVGSGAACEEAACAAFHGGGCAVMPGHVGAQARRSTCNLPCQKFPRRATLGVVRHAVLQVRGGTASSAVRKARAMTNLLPPPLVSPRDRAHANRRREQRTLHSGDLTPALAPRRPRGPVARRRDGLAPEHACSAAPPSRKGRAPRRAAVCGRMPGSHTAYPAHPARGRVPPGLGPCSQREEQ